jgi:integrase
LAEIAGEYIESREFNENSKTLLATRLKSNILPELGGIQAVMLTHTDLERYVYHRRKTVKANTVRREIVDIKAILNWAVQKHPPLIPYNPVRDFPMPRADDAVITPPSPQECAAILQHANHRLARAIKLAWYTGLRPGAVEMLSLTWGAVLWDRRIIRIQSADKGGPAMRDVPIHTDFFAELKAWWDADENGFGPVIHKDGRPIKSLKIAWRIAKIKAGITRRLRLYDLRHDFVTTALESGVDIKILAEIVGSAPETLRKHYQHVSGRSRVEAIEIIRSGGILSIGNIGNTKSEKAHK